MADFIKDTLVEWVSISRVAALLKKKQKLKVRIHGCSTVKMSNIGDVL